jgi:leukotriene A-4 hydrolase/aminopeptidase
MHPVLVPLLSVLALKAYAAPSEDPKLGTERDHHSHTNPEHVRVKHVDLFLEVDFEHRTINGTATLHVERTSGDAAQPLVLDSRDLRIEKVSTSSDGEHYEKTKFRLGKSDPILGAPLIVELPAKATRVRIDYRTGRNAAGLQWLDREQTATKKHPFLYTQSEPILARSWIPLQDSPAVRITYTAHVKVPRGMRAVMSASNDPKKETDGDFRFEMRQRIPSYLIALAVGDLDFRAIGPRTGVYAAPGVVEKAAHEFADLEKMVKATEELYGPYRWGRYDVLVLPPSFPLGGMENPRLTFATPTILAGDRSLISLVAHELAHSWSGNLVSNATWRDFWLNEGFTVYLERRIIEKVYGRRRAEMEAVLGRRSLEREMADLKPEEQILHIDLKGRDPDDGFTDVPYEKGALFLRHIEAVVGRERFDAFLKGYFDHFAFRSIRTEDFLGYLDKHLIKGDENLAKKLAVEEWVHKPGIPGVAPKLTAEALTRVEEQAKAWLAGLTPTNGLKTEAWSTQEWLHFLGLMPDKLDSARMKELDEAFRLTRSGNSEILFQWLLLSVRHGYEPAYPRLESFLTTVGRRKFLKPLYEELVKSAEGKTRALAIYRKARAGYHPMATATLDPIVGWKP